MASLRINPARRREILDALRRGTVPQNGLDFLAVGLDRFESAIDDELRGVSEGASGFKAVRGEYGAGKTFFGRWLAENARRRGFASSEVQISETETPLYRHETIYRRVVERLSTVERSGGALRDVVDAWFFALEQDALAEGAISAGDDDALLARTDELIEQRLARVGARAPAFSAALRGYRRAQAEGRRADADGLLAWLGGQPHVAAAVKRGAGVKGDVDHDAALGFLLGLLLVLRDSGHAGLVVVLDEVETLQRMRSDVRERSLNALRQLIDELDGGALPGLYLVVTGTSAFLDGPQGAQQLPPLAQRLATDFATDARFDNPRAVQIRLGGFDLERLTDVGRKVRDLYADGAKARERVLDLVGDPYIVQLAGAVTGQLGGRVGVAPRLFLKKLVADVLDRVDQFDDFRPNEHYALTLGDGELTPVERAARGAVDPDDIDLPS